MEIRIITLNNYTSWFGVSLEFQIASFRICRIIPGYSPGRIVTATKSSAAPLFDRIIFTPLWNARFNCPQSGGKDSSGPISGDRRIHRYVSLTTWKDGSREKFARGWERQTKDNERTRTLRDLYSERMSQSVNFTHVCFSHVKCWICEWYKSGRTCEIRSWAGICPGFCEKLLKRERYWCRPGWKMVF